MKIIICGAGRVGSAIAEYLAETDNEVIMIDKNQERLDALSESLDVQPLQGYASYPEMLERAQAEEADMLIAVTASDEVNMIACQAAQLFFNVPMKIARIRSREYTNSKYTFFKKGEAFSPNVIISPEAEIAKSIRRTISIPGAFDVLRLANGAVRLTGIHCDDMCPILNTPLRQLSKLFPDIHAVTVGIIRQGALIVPNGDARLQGGDDVYFVSDKKSQERLLSLFGYEHENASSVMILGGSDVALYLAQQLLKETPDMRVTIVEKNSERAEFLAKELPKSIVINGDFLDTEIMEEAGIEGTETVVALTSDDENNILASLTAKKYGASQTLTVVEKAVYAQLVTNLGVDVVIDPKDIIVSTILQHIHRGKIYSAYSLRSGLCEVLEADVFESSEFSGEKLRDIRLPAGVIIGAVVRDGQSVPLAGDTVIETGDRLIVFADTDAVKQIEKLFSSDSELF